MGDAATNCILYHDINSICSIMVRYTFAVRGKAADGDAGLRLAEEPIDIKRGEQLTEHYMCEINQNGQVPVLVPTNGDGERQKPIPDSVDITYFFAAHHPSLIPKDQEKEVKRLLHNLHEINFFSLTFTGKPEMQQKNTADLQRKLEEGVSERYQAAIQHKIQR